MQVVNIAIISTVYDTLRNTCSACSRVAESNGICTAGFQPPIHPYTLTACPFQGRGGLEPIPVVIGEKEGYT